MGSRYTIVSIFLAAFLLFACDAQARPILICTHLGFEPFVIHNEKEFRGIDIDIVQSVVERSGLNARLDVLPWARLLKALEVGACDVGFSLFDRENRREYVDYFFKVPIHFSTFKVFVRSGQDFTFEKVTDLYGLKVGFNRGFAMSHDLEEAIAAKQISSFEYDSVKSAFNMLSVGRVDAILDNEIRIRYFLREMGLKDQFEAKEVPFFPYRPAFLVFSKKSDLPSISTVKTLFQDILTQMDQIGEIEDITGSYVD